MSTLQPSVQRTGKKCPSDMSTVKDTYRLVHVDDYWLYIPYYKLQIVTHNWRKWIRFSLHFWQGLLSSDRHRWYCIPRMRPDQVWVFCQFDSRSKLRCVPHSAVKTKTYPNAMPRRSVESRCMVKYVIWTLLPAACGMVFKWVKLFFLLFLGHLAF